MAVITIREQSQTEKDFNATLVIDGNNYNITVSDPFEAKEEQELEWYFEEWLCYPMLDNVKADRAKDSVRKYGEELFKQVFQSDIKAYSKYSLLRSNLSQLQIEIESITPEFHAIHWEALQDPELSHPLSIDTVLIRKSFEPKIIETKVKDSPTINILVVVARPKADREGYRTISRPLVEAIRNAKLQVNLELLRPGTYKALAQHLEEKGNGYYHIVHFDVHGALKTYASYQAGIEDKDNPYLQPRCGRGKIKPYKGVKAFLALEGNKKNQADPVEASEIADLLTSKNIPVCILNACQSGKQLNQSEAEDNRETSLGSRLMNAGMQMVVAMSYSVTVTAAKIIMKQIYQHLFDKKDINQAIQLGRKELYNHKKRRAYYNTYIDLEDWLLPVVYSNGEVNFNLREFAPQEEKQYKSNLKTKYNFTEPTYGFVGRDLDILFIEKALLRHNILLLQGMGGTGKTTLLNYLREWWQVTKFAEDTFYFAYDKQDYNLQDMVRKIGKQVYNQFDFKCFKDKNFHEQRQELSDKLRGESYILILDNLESIVRKYLASQNTLNKTERKEIKKFLATLVGGKTKVVLGSRIGEEWLKKSTFRDNIYQLRGLDAQASTDFAENILRKIDSKQSLDEIKIDEYFQQLIKLLGGNPLAMEDILISLKDKSSEEILQFLEKGQIEQLINHKTNNSLKRIDSSYQKLSDSSQKLLLVLALFQGFICFQFIYQYAKELAKLKIFHNYNLYKLEDAITEAISWGLLSPINKDEPQTLLIQPLLTYFLNSKLKEIDEETREVLKKGFKNYYRNLSYLYAKLIISENPLEKQWGSNYIEWEYKNIYQSLQISLKEQESILSFLVCLRDYLILTNNQTQKLRLLEEIHNQYCNFIFAQDNKVYLEEKFLVSSMLGDHYISNKNYQQAKLIFQENLNLILRSKTIEKQTKQGHSRLASTYYELGRVNQYLKQFQLAKYYYNKSLKNLGATDKKVYLSIIYNQLGLIAQDLREYKEAKKLYQKSLELTKQDSYYFQAGVFHNLGWVNEELEELYLAVENYQKAIKIYDDYHDIYEQGDTYHQLGNTFYKLGKYEKAKESHQKALDIYIYHKDDYSQAKINEGLGLISQKLEDYEQSYDYYWKAYNFYKNKNDSSAKGRILNLLGSIFKENQMYKESQIYYQESLDRYKEDNDYFSQAFLCYELGYFSQELGEIEEAQDYYQQAFIIFPENGDHLIKARICNNLGMIAQDLEQYEYAEECYMETLDILSKDEERYYKTSTYNNLGFVAYKLSEFKKAKTYYLQALELYVEFEEKQNLGVTIKNVARLYQKTQDNILIIKVAAILNMTKAELKKLFEEINNE